MSSEGRSNRQAATDTFASEQRGRARQDKRVDPGKQMRRMPGSLTDAGLTIAINELPVGARLAADTVYKCWRDGKFADDEFISFLQSISTYSPVLQQMVHASAQDSAPGGKPLPGIPVRGNTMGGAQFAGAVGGRKIFGREAPQPQSQPQPLSEESEAAMGINKQWRSRRRREAMRRQCAGMKGTDHQLRVGYLCRSVTCLRQQLPPSAMPALLDSAMRYSRAALSPEAFAQQMQVHPTAEPKNPTLPSQHTQTHTCYGELCHPVACTCSRVHSHAREEMASRVCEASLLLGVCNGAAGYHCYPTWR